VLAAGGVGRAGAAPDGHLPTRYRRCLLALS